MDSWVTLGPLGNGCFSSIFLAVSSEGLPLVLKSSSCVEKFQSLQKQKFISENLQGCPEIVHCYGGRFSTEEGLRKYNLVFEYASRGCLHDLMGKYGGKIPESDAAGYTKMILKGLSEIHKRGFVHCDLKPEKILVFPPEEIDNLSQLKISDFGLTKVPGKEEEQNQKRKFPGTLIYMSPEAVTDGKIGAELDVWSLGCIVVEMITGERPLNKPPKIPNLSNQGTDFLSKCLEVTPERRWTADMLLKHPFVLKQYKRDVSLLDCGREIERQLLKRCHKQI